MASVTLYPSSYTLGTNGANFTNPGNMYSDNGVYATVTATVKSTTSQIYLTTFNYSAIPAGSTINSITINVDRKMSGTTSIQSVAIQAYKSTTAMGTKATSTAEPTTDTVFSNATTGTWVYADLANLRVLLEDIRGNSTVACTISYDYVSATVDYTPYNAVGTLSVSQASTVVVTGKTGRKGTAGVSQASTVAVTGTAYYETNDKTGSMSVSQNSTVSVAGKVGMNGSVSVSQSSTVVISGKSGRSGSVSVSQPSNIALSGKMVANGTASVSQGSSVSVSGKPGFKGSVSVSQGSTISVSGTQAAPSYDFFGLLDVVQGSSVAVSGTKNVYGILGVSQPSTAYGLGTKSTQGILDVVQATKLSIKSTTLFTTIVTHRTTTQIGVYALMSSVNRTHQATVTPQGKVSRIVTKTTYKNEVKL